MNKEGKFLHGPTEQEKCLPELVTCNYSQLATSVGKSIWSEEMSEMQRNPPRLIH